MQYELLRIIRRLWGSVYDLLAICSGEKTKKTVADVSDDLDVTEYLCRPFAVDEEWRPP